jgi:CDP-diacylglycerol--glycerol-3-phosphate 3-phosphatidyltransferase
LYYFLSTGDVRGGMLTFGAAAGSVLVSYVKARAEGLGYEARVGLLTRADRYLVLAPALVFNQVYLGLAILAVFANITALQRVFYVRRLVHSRPEHQN